MPGRSGVEALSTLLDFNHAPFFQGFIEIRALEEAKVLILNGVAGSLRWRDLQRGGAVLSAAFNPRRSGRIHCADGLSLHDSLRARRAQTGDLETNYPDGKAGGSV